MKTILSASLLCALAMPALAADRHLQPKLAKSFALDVQNVSKTKSGAIANADAILASIDNTPYQTLEAIYDKLAAMPEHAAVLTSFRKVECYTPSEEHATIALKIEPRHTEGTALSLPEAKVNPALAMTLRFENKFLSDISIGKIKKENAITTKGKMTLGNSAYYTLAFRQYKGYIIAKLTTENGVQMCSYPANTGTQ
ncbi:MAG: hypothetical protein WCS77_01700 [Elusimicrobiaceae bacterium]